MQNKQKSNINNNKANNLIVKYNSKSIFLQCFFFRVLDKGNQLMT